MGRVKIRCRHLRSHKPNMLGPALFRLHKCKNVTVGIRYVEFPTVGHFPEGLSYRDGPVLYALVHRVWISSTVNVTSRCSFSLRKLPLVTRRVGELQMDGVTDPARFPRKNAHTGSQGRTQAAQYRSGWTGPDRPRGIVGSSPSVFAEGVWLIGLLFLEISDIPRVRPWVRPYGAKGSEARAISTSSMTTLRYCVLPSPPRAGEGSPTAARKRAVRRELRVCVEPRDWVQ